MAKAFYNERRITGWKACLTERNMRKNYFNLTEMLVVIAVMLVMFEVAFQFFYDGSKLCTQAIERSFDNQEMFILSGKLRNIIHLTSGWKKENGCLVSGNKKLMTEKNRIFLIDENDRRELSLLPENATLTLDIEEHVDSADLAVLNIEIKGKKNITDRIRIVSCMR